MEVKEISPRSLTDLESLTRAVEYYRQINEEIARLQVSRDIARQSILEKFKETGMRWYDTPSGLRARVDTRKGADRIDVKEARQLLPKDLFDKLLRAGETIVVLSVRPIKSEEEE